MAEVNFQNRTLYHGDNLDVLRGMNSGTVHLIATDPPFKKGRDFHATPDSLAAGARFQDRWSWEDDVEGEWVDQITDDWPKVMNVINGSRQSYGDDMGAFLCFMGVRLLEMRRVLRDDGSIYLHCDPTASHYLKELMDAIFGKQNFRNEIIWCYEIGGRSKKQFSRKHDVILFYSRSRSFRFNTDAVRLPRRKTHMKTELDADGNEWQVKTDAKTGKVYRYPVNAGALCPDWWVGIQQLNREDKERFGYPTQKPLALYERIIKASSNEGDIVLDPFCGCATTPIAAERLSRRWVGIDIWEKAQDAVRQRMEDNRQLLTDIPVVHYEATPPQRTDDGQEAVPFLQVTERHAEPSGPKMSRAEMYDFLLKQYGSRCQGCDRTFDDPRYLELDHNTPRSDGGLNHISNRILLCGPCNRAKSNTYTLSGLRRLNAKNGWMAS